jgi:diaminopimelate epimerase
VIVVSGIGGDDFILLEMILMPILNGLLQPDGNQSTMCGNGGRCLEALPKIKKVIDNKAVFNAADGLHNVSLVKMK